MGYQYKSENEDIVCIVEEEEEIYGNRQTRQHRSEEKDGSRQPDGAMTTGSDSLDHFVWREMTHQASIN